MAVSRGAIRDIFLYSLICPNNVFTIDCLLFFCWNLEYGVVHGAV